MIHWVSEGQQLQTGETFLEIASLYHPPDCKQLLDEVFVISRIIKVEVGVIRLLLKTARI